MNIVLGHRTSHQVVFAGPFGVGKTTALRAVTDVPVTSTEDWSSEQYAADSPGKTTTTVGFDYGEWGFPDGTRVALIGVPGQERFNAMWDALLPQSSAIVLWLYGNRADSLADCRFWLEALAKRQAVARLAVALTRLPHDAPDCELEPFRRLIGLYHPLAPVITSDPREPASVMQAIMVALSTPYSEFKS
jgi:signal recognition particle receptor subunit beta